MVSFLEKVRRINLVKDLDKKQELVDYIYEDEGFTDEVLDLQLEINKKRNKENIPDTKENVYKNYVQ